jgi:hypothetical protein
MAARARVLASLGQILMVTLLIGETKGICEQAVEAARAAGTAEIECHALDSLGVTNVYLGNLEVGLEQLRASLDLALQIGSVDEATRAQGNIVDVLSWRPTRRGRRWPSPRCVRRSTGWGAASA